MERNHVTGGVKSGQADVCVRQGSANELASLDHLADVTSRAYVPAIVTAGQNFATVLGEEGDALFLDPGTDSSVLIVTADAKTDHSK